MLLNSAFKERRLKKKSWPTYFIFNFNGFIRGIISILFSVVGEEEICRGRFQSKVSHVREGQVGKRPHKNKVRSYSLLILTVGGTSP